MRLAIATVNAQVLQVHGDIFFDHLCRRAEASRAQIGKQCFHAFQEDRLLQASHFEGAVAQPCDAYDFSCGIPAASTAFAVQAANTTRWIKCFIRGTYIRSNYIRGTMGSKKGGGKVRVLPI